MLRRMIAPVSALALAGFLAGAAPAGAVTRTFTTTMTGAQEVPIPGDPDGTGIARVTVDTATGRICYVLTVQNIATPTAAHIHVAPPGEPGPVVQPLAAPVRGRSAGCVTNQQVASAIAANPHRYYVNVHNVPFPGGAVRGQL